MPIYPKLPALALARSIPLRERCRFGLLSVFVLTAVCGVGLMLGRDVYEAGSLMALVTYLPAAGAINACAVLYVTLRRAD
jgi:hypothetical protein